MPLRKHFAFRKNGRVYINQSAYAALQQEGNRLQNKRNLEREKAMIAASAALREREKARQREIAQLQALTEFLEARGARNQAAMPPPQPVPQIAVPPAVNIMRGLPNSFRTGIPLLLSRFRELGEIVSVAVFHSRKHARPSKSKLQAVAAFGGNPVVRPAPAGLRVPQIRAWTTQEDPAGLGQTTPPPQTIQLQQYAMTNAPQWALAVEEL